MATLSKRITTGRARHEDTRTRHQELSSSSPGWQPPLQPVGQLAGLYICIAALGVNVRIDGVNQNGTFCARRIVHRHTCWVGDLISYPNDGKGLTVIAGKAERA